MNSMLRQHQIRMQDLKGYLRGYDPAPAKLVAQDEWAKTESVDFEPGMLVFCLESATVPPNLSSFGKKEGEGEMFRVKDLCIVVGKENGRPLVVSITASAYELRFLEALMLEKARKAILDAKEFHYVAAKPAKPLSEATIKEIGQLGNVYAQGGSRRSLTVESSGPMEPAVALLAALGVRINAPGGKQVLDIGSICYMLFTSESKQPEDKNRTLLKTCFVPLPSNATPTSSPAQPASTPEAKTDQDVSGSQVPLTPEARGEPVNPNREARPSPTLKEESEEADDMHADVTEGFDYALFGQLTEPPPELVSDHLQLSKPASPAPAASPQPKVDSSARSKELAQGQALFEALTPESDKGPAPAEPPRPAPPAAPARPAATPLTKATGPAQTPPAQPAKPQVPPTPAVQPADAGKAAAGSPKAAEPESTTGDANPPATYKHLAEALSGLMDSEADAERQQKPSETKSAPADAGRAGKPLKAKERNNQPEPATSQTSKPAVPDEKPSQAPEKLTPATITGDHEPVSSTKSSQSASPFSAAATGDNIPAFKPRSQGGTESSMSTASTAFQEPQAVMNEMASLMSKLEQQVSKASKKLASRAEEIEQRLNRRTETLLDEASQDDKNTEASILVLCDSLTKQFEQLSEELRLKISDAAAAGRESIKGLQGNGQEQIDETRTSRQEELLKACKTFRSDTEALGQATEEHFHKIAKEQMEAAEALIKSVLEHLKEIAEDFESRLNQRFQRFTERMAEESGAVINSIQRNVHSMEEEIDGSWERASEKLKSSQADFEQTIEHTLSATELSIAQGTRVLLIEQFLPRLKERKEIVLGMAAEMSTAFSEQSVSQTRSQLTGLDTSLASARQQLNTLSEECLARIDSVGRQQQAGLEDLFKDTSSFMETSTADVLGLVEKTEQQIQDVEGVCKKLAETSSLDTDPHLTDERNAAVGKVQSLKGKLKTELDKTLESTCTQLEQLGQTVQSQLNNRRLEQTQVIREASENGLNRIKEAIQEAFNSVQSAREKYME